MEDWWAPLKTFINTTYKSPIPPLESNGHVYTDEHDKANIFNNSFQCRTILDDKNANLPELPTSFYQTRLSNKVLTPLEVDSAIKMFKIGKASGPNGLSNRILKELCKEVSSPFCSLFNRPFQIGILPLSDKDANVSSMPKEGDLSVVSNHRPTLSLYCLKNMFKPFANHLEANNVLSSLQSVFIPGDFTVNQLMILYHTFCEALARKEVRDVFCDISKALDRVWHADLIHKL